MLIEKLTPRGKTPLDRWVQITLLKSCQHATCKCVYISPVTQNGTTTYRFFCGKEDKGRRKGRRFPDDTITDANPF